MQNKNYSTLLKVAPETRQLQNITVHNDLIYNIKQLKLESFLSINKL